MTINTRQLRTMRKLGYFNSTYNPDLKLSDLCTYVDSLAKVKHPNKVILTKVHPMPKDLTFEQRGYIDEYGNMWSGD